MNSGPSNATSNPFHVPSIDFSWNSLSKILLSDDAIATKFGGSMINFALKAFPISNLPEPDSDIENFCPYASETGSTVVSNSDFISWWCNSGFFWSNSAAAPLTWGAA